MQTFGNQIHYNNFIDNTNYAIEGFLCFDNARLNHWDGHQFPYLKNDILVGGFIKVHPCIKKQINLH